MKYYRILDNLDLEDRWFLGDFLNDTDDDPWKYTYAKKIDKISKKLKIEVFEKGRAMDFTFANFDIPIISNKVASLFSEEEVQLIPIKINEDNTKDLFNVLVVLNEIDCVDEKRSDFIIWEENNKIRPDKAGLYKNFFKLVIDSDKVKGHNIFRVKKFDIAVIVSEEIKTKFDSERLSGVKFEEVVVA